MENHLWGGIREASWNVQTPRREMMVGSPYGWREMVDLSCALDEESKLCEGWRKERMMTSWFGA